MLNLSPDSFSDGRTYTVDTLHTRIAELIRDGADIIDVGAEPTSPGSHSVTPELEHARLAPFFACCRTFDIPFSLDTRHASTAQLGIQA